MSFFLRILIIGIFIIASVCLFHLSLIIMASFWYGLKEWRQRIKLRKEYPCGLATRASGPLKWGDNQ